ncbi:uncharacterized protein LOC129608386, partial [Condylostylus longicornis]|uniref:uncharacterized protein LOC129608386 n=1 Tax=Condylostylus longicornis TaxID=2530218 RepID=UPI00244DFC89
INSKQFNSQIPTSISTITNLNDNISSNNNNRNSNNNNNNNNNSNGATNNYNNNNNNVINNSNSYHQTTDCISKWKSGKQTVECIDKSLIRIPENIDPQTQVLDMSGNNLQNLANEQFLRASLLNLQKLYLRNCKIGEIQPETFKGLTNLVDLDLSHNLLVIIPSNALSYIPSLRDLTLASNHIHKIDSHSFRNTPSLQKLDLSHCDIQTIAPQAFEGLESLVSLKLNGNKLSELRPRTIETLSKLHGIELHDNPWLCDCRLRATKIWLTENNIPYPVAPMCSGGPERIIDRTFADLQVDDFACRPDMLPVVRYVEATMGENATILCRTSAIPAAQVNWYWNGRLLVNGSTFSAYQKVYLFEDGQFEKKSKLVLTNAQETDSSEFYCVAENRAGTAEANFTLHVSMRPAGIASFGSGQIVGLSAALVILILVILLVILFMLVRLKRQPFVESKTPNHLEVITSVNHSNTITSKTQPPSAQNNGGTQNLVVANGSIPNHISASDADQKHHHGQVNPMSNESKLANPVQKPPRLTDLPYTTSNYDTSGSIINNSNCFVSPTASAGNNPDLINDTKRFGSEEFTDLKIPAVLTSGINLTDPSVELPGSGEYSRAGGCDSLYPSGLWESNSTATTLLEDAFLKRATSTTLTGYSSYTDKTPIMDDNASSQMYDLQERLSSASDYFSRTFPRTHFQAMNSSTAMGAIGTSTSSAVSGLTSSSSTATTTTMLNNCSDSGSNLLNHQLNNSITSNINSNITTNNTGGYPSDYGLPLVPGAETQINHQMNHPLYQQQQQQSQQQQHQFNNNNNNNNNTSNSFNNSSNSLNSNNSSNSNNNLKNNGTVASMVGLINSRTNDQQQYQQQHFGQHPTTTNTATLSHHQQQIQHQQQQQQHLTSSGSSGQILPNGMPVNAKTIRVWQKGGVPVLPPVTALKRALISSSRNSPDEGYQEGCGTDV